MREGQEKAPPPSLTVLINLGTVPLEPGVSRQLPRPFLDEREVRRWQQATTALFVAGELRRED